MVINIIIGSVIGLFWVCNQDRFKLGCWIFNDQVDDTLDSLLRKKLGIGIKSMVCERYLLKIEFKDGTKAELWNSNKYHAWISEGNIDSYYWRDARPKASTMILLRDAIKGYYLRD